MTINFILNGEDVELKARSADRLSDLLREHFGLLGLKTDCNHGVCGKCLILLDGRLVPSCMIPVFKIRGREVITIEGFSQTEEYVDIIDAFNDTGVESCGFCNSGKILAAASILEHRDRPSPTEILAELSAVSCRCSDPDTLVKAVLAASDNRSKRLYHRVGK